MNTQTDESLVVEDLRVSYGAVEAVRGVSLRVDQNEVIAIIGGNGAGKSSVMNSISGLAPVTAGRILWAGEDLSRLHPAKRVPAGVVQVPQGARVMPEMSVTENLQLGAYHRRRRFHSSQMDDVFHWFPELKDRRTQLAGTLSGGERQMVAVGRAMMAEPRLLMLDEPSAGLAPRIVRQMFERLRKIAEQGIGMLLVEQNARAALELADRGYVLERGKCVLSGQAEEILASPRVKAAYLGEWFDRTIVDRRPGEAVSDSRPEAGA